MVVLQGMISMEQIDKAFDGKQVLQNVTLDIPDGQICGIFGKSGIGKSTLAKVLCGICPPDGGRILLDGQCLVSQNTPYDRKLGLSIQMVYQQPYATLDPRQKIGSGFKELIRYHGFAPRGEERALTEDVLVKVGLEPQILAHLPHQISGGEAQRVAIARALVNRPKVLLLDEPLGALDLKLRKDMQLELKKIQQQVGITFIYVTHDQEEALAMSDTVVVMDEGKIQQIGTPEDIYNEPKNAFVADFIGESNIIDGIMRADGVVEIFNRRFQCLDKGFAKDEPVDVVIRPEDVDIVPEGQGQLKGTVTSVTFKGMQYDIIVDFRGFKWLIQTTDHSPEGARIGVKIDPDGFHIMKKSEYSGQFGDYSSYSEEYEELADASLETDEEESGDEE